MSRLGILAAAFISGGVPFNGNAQSLSSDTIDLSSSGQGAYSLGFLNPLFPGNSNAASFNASLDGGSVLISNVDTTLGEPFSFYLASAGTVFGPSYVNGNTPAISNLASSPQFQVPLLQPFYLALWQGDTSHDQGQTFVAVNGDSYGWVELDAAVDTKGNLTLSSPGSAISNPSGGIIVGTDQVLEAPEPHIDILVLGGWIVCVLLKRFIPKPFMTGWE